jgi:hypothetical protein
VSELLTLKGERMSTRSTTHFKWSADEDSIAIIYRHPDGYPEGHGQFLVEFLDDLAENVPDPRFSDPSYLAAKLVVALAREFNVDYSFGDNGPVITPKEHPLDFLSVGVVSKDPSDIEYRYDIICQPRSREDFRPLVQVYERQGDGFLYSSEFHLLGTIEEVLSEQAEAQAGV